MHPWLVVQHLSQSTEMWPLVLGQLFSIWLVLCDHEDRGTQGLFRNLEVIGEGPLDQVLQYGGQPMLTDVLWSHGLGQVEVGNWDWIEVL
jgi:hypothetical protein